MTKEHIKAMNMVILYVVGGGDELLTQTTEDGRGW